MRLAKPPSSEWWNGHYYFVGHVLPYNMTFCSRESRFELYWQVIQQVYDFEENLPFYQVVLSFRRTSRRFWVLCTEILSRTSLIRYQCRCLLHCPPRNLARKYRNSYEAWVLIMRNYSAGFQLTEHMRTLFGGREYTVYGRQCQSGAKYVYWNGGNYVSRCLHCTWRNGLWRGINSC